MHLELNEEQKRAYELLDSEENVFLTGAAGSGKSTLLTHWLDDREHWLSRHQRTPILASTGAAAILIGGRTFHGFFGIGIMKGGAEATFQEAIQNYQLVKRLRRHDQVVIDEISMLSGPVVSLAERITREVRSMERPELKDVPWGGMRIIAVGDFAQLPPVNPHSKVREWVFLDEVWKRTDFKCIMLKQVMRTTDPDFIRVLNKIRVGVCDADVISFLDGRTKANGSTDTFRLFSHRENTERYNLERLAAIPHPVYSFRTQYAGPEWAIQQFGKNLPIPNNLQLKVDARVMFRTNDPGGAYANGTCGTIVEIEERYVHEPKESDGSNGNSASVQSTGRLTIELESGNRIQVTKHCFECLDKDGEVVLRALNFPVTLAWASTIHKAQGMTVSEMITDIRKLWEPGQAYVALSRVKTAEGLFLAGWSPSAIFADKQVIKFHEGIQ